MLYEKRYVDLAQNRKGELYYTKVIYLSQALIFAQTLISAQVAVGLSRRKGATAVVVMVVVLCYGR